MAARCEFFEFFFEESPCVCHTIQKKRERREREKRERERRERERSTAVRCLEWKDGKGKRKGEGEGEEETSHR